MNYLCMSNQAVAIQGLGQKLRIQSETIQEVTSMILRRLTHWAVRGDQGQPGQLIRNLMSDCFYPSDLIAISLPLSFSWRSTYKHALAGLCGHPYKALVKTAKPLVLWHPSRVAKQKVKSEPRIAGT